MRGGNRSLDWRGTTEMGGQDDATALILRGPQGWGEPGLKREDVVLGKAGLTEATTSLTVSTVCLTAPVGCHGKKVHGALDMCAHGKETEFFTFFYRNVL